MFKCKNLNVCKDRGCFFPETMRQLCKEAELCNLYCFLIPRKPGSKGCQMSACFNLRKERIIKVC